MRKFLYSLLLICVSCPAWCAITRVQNVQATIGAGASNSKTVTITSSGAHLLLGFSETGAGTALTISDNLSQTWTLIDSASDTVNSHAWAGLWCVDSASGVTSVTFSGLGFNQSTFEVLEYSGATCANLDAHKAQNQGPSTTSFSSGTTLSTAQAGELVVSCVGNYLGVGGAGTWTQSQSFTLFDNVPSSVCAEDLSAAVGAKVFSGTSPVAGNITAVIATFKATGGGGGATCPHNLSLLGAGCS